MLAATADAPPARQVPRFPLSRFRVSTSAHPDCSAVSSSRLIKHVGERSAHRIITYANRNPTRSASSIASAPNLVNSPFFPRTNYCRTLGVGYAQCVLNRIVRSGFAMDRHFGELRVRVRSHRSAAMLLPEEALLARKAERSSGQPTDQQLCVPAFLLTLDWEFPAQWTRDGRREHETVA